MAAVVMMVSIADLVDVAIIVLMIAENVAFVHRWWSRVVRNEELASLLQAMSDDSEFLARLSHCQVTTEMAPALEKLSP
jgi:hypothetical protein